MDHVYEWLKSKGPVTRADYVNTNWFGKYDPNRPLPAELEAEIPEELQMTEGEPQEEVTEEAGSQSGD